MKKRMKKRCQGMSVVSGGIDKSWKMVLGGGQKNKKMWSENDPGIPDIPATPDINPCSD